MSQSTLFKYPILQNNRFVLLLILVTRAFVVFGLDCMPPMESQYIFMADKLFNSHEKIFISFAPGYSALLYLINLPIDNYRITSYLIFVLSSTLFCYIIYKWASEKYNRETGIISLYLLLFLPNAAISYAGYTHCIVAALSLLTLSAYRFWKLWRNETTFNHLAFVLPALCAIALRPELILLFMFLMVCFYFFRLTGIMNCTRSELTWKLMLFPVMLTAFLYIHKSFVKSRNVNENTSAFSDSFYSYRSFVSVYCFRQEQPFTDSLAVALSTPHFGTPQENNNSIAKAISKNPIEVIKNVAYNFLQALKLIPHPLVVPFYLFFFVGLAIFNKNQKLLNRFNLFLVTIAAIPVATLFFFIVLVKYVGAVVIPVIMLASTGINSIANKRAKYWTVLMLMLSLFAISLLYFLSFVQTGARG